jgi:hypothetical protein
MKTIAMILILFLTTPALAVDVTLSWTAPDDDRVTGYFVYYGTSNPPVPSNGGTELDAGSATQQIITDLTEGTDYYFGAKSYDADGNTSVMSDILEWTAEAGPQTIQIPHKPSEIRLIFE